LQLRPRLRSRPPAAASCPRASPSLSSRLTKTARQPWNPHKMCRASASRGSPVRIAKPWHRHRGPRQQQRRVHSQAFLTHIGAMPHNRHPLEQGVRCQGVNVPVSCGLVPHVSPNARPEPARAQSTPAVDVVPGSKRPHTKPPYGNATRPGAPKHERIGPLLRRDCRNVRDAILRHESPSPTYRLPKRAAHAATRAR